MKNIYSTLITLIHKWYVPLFFLLAAAAGFLCFRCLGGASIDSWDEARHGISAYEMIRSRNYLVNTFKGSPDYWNVKPPVSFWAVIAGFKLFGYTAVGLRFFSALAYFAMVVITGLFARRYGKLASLFTMAFLSANYFPFKAHLARAGDADSLYLLLFTLSMLAMLKIREDARWLYACGLCFSLAFLTKSFHAGAIAAVGGLFLLLTGEIKRLRPRIWAGFLMTAFFPVLVWGFLRFQYDGTLFFRSMYEADIAGRTALGGTEGHGAPFTFYLTSVFWNFDYIYGFLSLILLLGILYILIRPLRTPDTPLPQNDQVGILLWLFIPLLLFSCVSTKLMWYVYPCLVPLSLLSAVFLARFLENPKIPAGIVFFCLVCTGAGTLFFLWNNYADNVRGVRTNDLQTFVMEQFDQDSALSGSVVYLDAYDPFLYANTDTWEQNMRLLAMMEGDLICQDGGADAYLSDENPCLLILSIPFLQDHPELEEHEILADNGQYLLIGKK